MTPEQLLAYGECMESLRAHRERHPECCGPTDTTCAACGFEFEPGDHTFTDDNDRTFCDGYCHADYLDMRASDGAS